MAAHRVSSISIKGATAVNPIDIPIPSLSSNGQTTPQQAEQLPPLTLDILLPFWEQTLDQLQEEQPKLVETLRNRELKVDDNDHFLIIINNSYTDSEIKPHLVQLLSILRRLTSRPMLNCSTHIIHEEKEAVIYSPRDKYDVMSQANTTLEMFRILFPEVDY